MNVFEVMKWRTPLKQGPRKGTDADVTISMVKDNGRNRFSIFFKNETAALVSPNNGRISYAAGFGVIGFKETGNSGWTLSGKEGSGTKKVQITAVTKEDEEFLTKMIGDYSLQYDETSKVYYVSMEGRIK